jgi:hypothetical protein
MTTASPASTSSYRALLAFGQVQPWRGIGEGQPGASTTASSRFEGRPSSLHLQDRIVQLHELMLLLLLLLAEWGQSQALM